jgi:hypothetical protein
MFRFMKRFGSDSHGRRRGTGPLTRGRRRNYPLNCEALDSRQLLSGYYIVNAASGKVLDDPGFSTSEGYIIDQYQLNGGANQQWNLDYLSNGNVEIVNESSNQFLDDPDYATGPHVIDQWDWNGGANQQWQLDQQPNGNYVIVNAYSNLALADPKSSTSNTTQIIQFQPDGGYEQQWDLLAAGQSANIGADYLVNASSQQVLDDPDYSSQDGTPMDQWDYNGGTNQLWELNPLPDGNYLIQNQFNQKVLDDPASSTADGTHVIQYQPDGGANQEWTLVPLADGNDLIVNLASGYVLDDPAASTAEGQSIIQYQPDGGANQEWTLFEPNLGASSLPNWSGYVAATNLANPQANSVSAVQGDWIVPTVTGPSSGSFYMSTWVGIDGYANSTVEQLGTDQQVVNGTTYYSAWWEMWSTNGYKGPGGRVEQPISGFTIQPGDSIGASVENLGAGQYNLSMQDFTQNESFSITVSSAQYQSPQAQGSTAEWIVETPSSGGRYSNLPNFGLVTFTGAVATINNVTGPIDDSSWQSTAINIYTNAELDTTSVLNDTADDGSSFYVIANPGASGSASGVASDTNGVASGTNVGTATGNGTAVGVTLLSGTRTGAPAIGGRAGDGTLSTSRYSTLIGERGRPAQGFSSDLAALDAVFADYDPMQYHLMSGGRRRGRLLGGLTSTGA